MYICIYVYYRIKAVSIYIYMTELQDKGTIYKYLYTSQDKGTIYIYLYILQDKGSVQEENEKLTASIFKLGKQSERLSQELQNHLHKNKQLKDKTAKLETALEKVRCNLV